MSLLRRFQNITEVFGHQKLPFISLSKMGENVMPEEAIAGDFQDEDSKRNFAFINKLHSLGIPNLIDLPQVCLPASALPGALRCRTSS
jgi:hypothetical protein